MRSYCRKEFERIDKNIERLSEMDCVQLRKKFHAMMRTIAVVEDSEPRRVASVRIVEQGRRRDQVYDGHQLAIMDGRILVERSFLQSFRFVQIM
jgi:hypothetical protein